MISAHAPLRPLLLLALPVALVGGCLGDDTSAATSSDSASATKGTATSDAATTDAATTDAATGGSQGASESGTSTASDTSTGTSVTATASDTAAAATGDASTDTSTGGATTGSTGVDTSGTGDPTTGGDLLFECHGCACDAATSYCVTVLGGVAPALAPLDLPPCEIVTEPYADGCHPFPQQCADDPSCACLGDPPGCFCEMAVDHVDVTCPLP